jgi:hypothetical protein
VEVSNDMADENFIELPVQACPGPIGWEVHGKRYSQTSSTVVSAAMEAVLFPVYGWPEPCGLSDFQYRLVFQKAVGLG